MPQPRIKGFEEKSNTNFFENMAIDLDINNVIKDDHSETI